MNFLRSLIAGLALAVLTSGAAQAQCGTTAPANKFCGNDTGASALATWKSIPATALSAIAGGTVLGNPTGVSAVPIATRSPVLGIPGSQAGLLGIAGVTSGTAFLQAQPVAGAGVSLLPTSDGTLVSTASTPLVINPTTGLMTCPTCVTSSGGGAITGTAPIAVSGAGVVSINAPYTTLTASNGGIVYSGATNLAILAGTATARQMLQSGASAAPAWSTATWPATTTINQILYSSAANTVVGLSTANNAVLSTNGSGVPSLSTTLPSGLAATNMALTTPTLTSPTMTDPVLGVATGTSLALGGCTLGANQLCAGSSAFGGAVTITSNAASALAVGANGATNPALLVNASGASSATGLVISSAAAGSAAGITVISSGANEALVINAKGSGTINIGANSTGGVALGAGGGGVTATGAFRAIGTGGSISATSADGSFSAGGNRAFMDITGGNARIGSLNGGGAAVSMGLFVNNTAAVQFSTAGLPTSGTAVSSTGGFPVNIASGTSALGTGAISSGTCASVVTTAATNVATTDVLLAGFNGDPTATTGYVPSTAGMLTIIAYPSANNVNFKVCNNTGSSITPGAVTLNWRVVR